MFCSILPGGTAISVKTLSLSLRSAIQLLALASTGIVAGCARQPPPVPGDAPSLLSGFVHGFVALPSLLASLLMEVRVYAFPNSGFWYDFGFCVGFTLGIVLLALPIIPFIGGFLTRKN
jgi:hypothetical protein